MVLQGVCIAAGTVEISPREEGTVVRNMQKQRLSLDIDEVPKSK